MTNKETIEVLTSNVVENPELMFEALEMAIKVLEQARWIPISEQYPIIGQDVLISKGDFVLIDTFCYDSIDETYYFDNYDDVEAWMPLPQPYKTESEGK